MGSLCNFRPMGYPQYLKLSTMPNNRQVLYPFNRPNITARLSRTRNRIPCLVLAQKTNNNGRNPEEKRESSDNSLNVGGNGILPKEERAEQTKRGKKYRPPSLLEEAFVIALELLNFSVSMCIYAFQRLKSSIKIEFNLENLKYMCVGFLSFLITAIFVFPIVSCWYIFLFVLEKTVKILAIGAIIGYAYIYLLK